MEEPRLRRLDGEATGGFWTGMTQNQAIIGLSSVNRITCGRLLVSPFG
jgi:hypothetical protein